MKVLYITFLNEDIRPGYRLKIHSQVKCLSELCGECQLLIMGNKEFNLYNFRKGEKLGCFPIAFKRKRHQENRNMQDELLLFFQFCNIAKEIIKKENPTIIYVRRIIPITPILLNLLRFIKKRNISIVYEYPTYPWEKEMKNWARTDKKMILFYLLDKIMYNSLINIVDLVAVNYVIHSDDHYNVNQKFVEIQNSGDAMDFPLIKKKQKRTDVHFIGIAHVRREHGYDILIKAIRDYYQNSPERYIYFDIVGTIEQSLNLEKMVTEYHLENYIRFHGFQTGQTLDYLCDNADIGVNLLSPLLSGKGVTTLKTVEYAFRGLYQICSAPLLIDGGNTATPEFLYVYDNISPLNICKVLEAYDKCKLSPSDIRAYACEHMTWEPCMEKILKYLYH